MRILVINANTSVKITKIIDSAAKQGASPGTEITTVNPQYGPELISGAYHTALQVPRVIALIEKNKNDYDTFIIACMSDPGLDACRLVTKNVIGVGEAAIMTACSVAKRFSSLSTTKRGAWGMWERLRSLGVDQSRCASARVVGSGMADETASSKSKTCNLEVVEFLARKTRDEMLDACCQVGQDCINEDGAGALVLWCVALSDLNEDLSERLKVPVISGVASAIKIAEQLPT